VGAEPLGLAGPKAVPNVPKPERDGRASGACGASCGAWRDAPMPRRVRPSASADEATAMSSMRFICATSSIGAPPPTRWAGRFARVGYVSETAPRAQVHARATTRARSQLSEPASPQRSRQPSSWLYQALDIGDRGEQLDAPAALIGGGPGRTRVQLRRVGDPRPRVCSGPSAGPRATTARRRARATRYGAGPAV